MALRPPRFFLSRLGFLMRTFVVILLSLAPLTAAGAQDDFERPPIEYSKSEPRNRISALQEKLDRGEVKLQYEKERGYLTSVLSALQIPAESQSLVFSKTSLQLHRISPHAPRALYFTDDLYIGYCRAGDVMEISAVDPALGAVFYTLDQRSPEKPPKFQRQTESCLVCHSSSRTEGVPGHLVRSLFVDRGGQPILSAGSRTVNHTTPFEQRWGGWYVTGEHGDQKHLGNLIAEKDVQPHAVKNENGLNVVSLEKRFATEHYLTPHSDIVALMVLEHQTFVHNQITHANFATRQALDYDAMMGKVLEKKEGERLESTTRRIQSAGDKLVDALLFVDEAPLTAAVRGTSKFAERFVQQGPRDSKGRSLRDFDLTKRMFKYPCSYLIYSEAFDALPKEMHEYISHRFNEILGGKDDSKKFAHLSSSDCQAILEILRETKPALMALRQ
jgi:hypothetical protein